MNARMRLLTPREPIVWESSCLNWRARLAGDWCSARLTQIYVGGATVAMVWQTDECLFSVVGFVAG
jgi:hypothetical protein